MSGPRSISDSLISNNENITEKTVWKDFLALIKIGIVNSNLITTFTGIWLAISFTDKSFFASLDIVFFTLVGSALIIRILYAK